MATEILAQTAAQPPHREPPSAAKLAALHKLRDEAIYRAGSELCALAAMLRREAGTEDLPVYLPSVASRIEALACASQLLAGSSSQEGIAREYQIVVGRSFDAALETALETAS